MQKSRLTVGVNVSVHRFQLLGEVHHHVVGVEQRGEGSVHDLGRVGRVWADVGQQQRGAEGLILLLDFCPNTIF